ncbi:MAG: tRNA 5-methoxyuridine(34)/uridine 5-oxyacetic acid(34) synthase CmoB [Candidatus Thiodiazotropha lotti]|nr:tRNA 5-methoxyuridine(34)/uridine 5-oxyacetic acid(34) synthase CmoB [Candidatus Thiodiazotropha lotti]
MNYDWDWCEAYSDHPLGRWLKELPQQVERVWREQTHGDIHKWREALARLPDIPVSKVNFRSAKVEAGDAADCDDPTRSQIVDALQQLHPWRKGPYRICGIEVDTEWRSDLKWDRLVEQISPLKNRTVLDVGCGNGYHLWRIHGEGAMRVIGIDPTQLFNMQFEAFKHFLGNDYPVHLFPLGIEDLPMDLKAFDTVFSMGVFYHRQSPFSHLYELMGALRKEGELVLETLVIEGGDREVLVPENRYAKMRNVWFIPTAETLKGWMKRCGFRDIRLVDISTTTTTEQRSTEWMRFESLKDYLDPLNPDLTIEGYPAPRRAILVAKKGRG